MLLLGLAAEVQAQPTYTFQYLTVSNGLSQSTVEAMAQDRFGFIWLATQDGLNRYDGYSVDTFRPVLNNPNSLSHHRLTSLLVDHTGDLWIGTADAGLDRLDPETLQFSHYTHRPNTATSLSSNAITALAEGAEGAMWIGTADAGVNRLDTKTGVVSRIEHTQGLDETTGAKHITALRMGHDGTLWIGTAGGGVYRYNPNTGTTLQFRYAPAERYALPHDHIRALFQAKDRTLWVSTEAGGVSRLDPETGTFTTYGQALGASSPLGKGVVSDIAQSADGRLWLGVIGEGIRVLDEKTGAITSIQERQGAGYMLSNRMINCLLIDRFDILWMGYDGGGAKWFDVNRGQIRFYTHDPGDPLSLQANQIGSVHEDHAGGVWIGTIGGGLSRIEPETQRAAHYTNDPLNPNSLSDITVSALHEDDTGTLWVGTLAGGLNRFDPATRQFKRFQHNPEDPFSISNNTVKAIQSDPEGNLWIGTDDGLNFFNPATEKFLQYRYESTYEKSISGDQITALAGTPNGLWIGTYGAGLNYFNYQTQTFYRYLRLPGVEGGLRSNVVLGLQVDATDPAVVWIGTDNGLQMLNPVSDTFVTYHTANSELPNNIIKGMAWDDGGDLWLSTNGGISRFSPLAKRFKNYSTEWQFQSTEFRVGVAHRGASGTLYFGGINGLNAFKVEALTGNPHPPAIVVRDLDLFDQSIQSTTRGSSTQILARVKRIELPHKASVITFRFSALHFTYPENNRYAFKLEGFDESWRHAGPERRATYTNLEPGDYTFRVTAANSDGVWNDKGVELQLTVHPPWYRAWWANLLYLGLFAFGAVGLVKLQFRITRRRLELTYKQRELDSERRTNERLRELDRLKSAFLSNMSHEIRTPLTAVIGFASLLDDDFSEENKSLVPLIMQGGQRLLRTINSVLDLAQLENGRFHLNKEVLNLTHVVQETVGFFRPQANKKGLGFHLILPQATHIEAELDRHIFERILANLIGNAIKFTETGQITVGVRGINNEVRIWVSDTGLGISQDFLPYIFDKFRQESTGEARTFEGSGLGLSITKHLVEFMGGAIAVESEKGKGTSFVVRFPATVQVNRPARSEPKKQVKPTMPVDAS